MQKRKNDTGLAAELQLVFSPQEKARYLVEALIQAVLNSNPEVIDAAEPFDCVLLVVRTVKVHSRNSSLSN
jgi:hypothetical protein